MDVFVAKATQLGPLASPTLTFAVYDQPAHPCNVNEDYDDFKLFLGLRMCNLSVIFDVKSTQFSRFVFTMLSLLYTTNLFTLKMSGMMMMTSARS